MAEKDKIMVNWINGFNAGNKKEKYEITFRLGTFTVLEIKACLFCEEGCSKKRFRFMMLNLGFEI
jgi:hypothetical protein